MRGYEVRLRKDRRAFDLISDAKLVGRSQDISWVSR
jgi:hypothetical protein